MLSFIDFCLYWRVVHELKYAGLWHSRVTGDKKMSSLPTGTDLDLHRSREEKSSVDNTLPESEGLTASAEAERLYRELQARHNELEMLKEELNRTQAELALFKERYFDLYDRAPVGYLTISAEGVILGANLAAASMIGAACGALIRQPMSLIIPEDYRDIFDVHCKQLFGTGESSEFDIQLKKTDGTLLWAHLEATVAQSADGVATCRAVISDISGRKQTENKLRLLSCAVEHSPVSIVITDAHGTIQFVNPKFIELTGYSAEEVVGQNPRILNSGKTAPELFENLWATITLGKTWEGDIVNKKKDGSLFWEHTKIIGLRRGTGAITHYLAVKEDITEKRNLLAELTSVKEQVNMASQAKSNFLAVMSHEIRTPMNGVIGMNSLLLETELNSEQREYAEIVRKSGESLLSLIHDILDLSAIESGKLDLEVLDFDLRVTLEDTAEMLAVRAADAGLEQILRVDPAVPSYLRGDPGRLRQMISNLVSNAIKFTPKGEIVISAALQSQNDNFVTVHFGILDTGIGIPESKLASILEPFTQVNSSSTRKYGGAGLGLAICRQLAELMGGEIGVISEEGKGSIFWFTARFEKQDPHTSKFSHTSVSKSIVGTKILIVDDNPTNRTLMTTFLDRWGCRYQAVSDGETGLAVLLEAAEKNDQFQIVLLDQKMPGMDGMELGRRIKANPLLASIPIVMVTSIGQRGDVAILEQIGFDGYLVKPVRHSQLRECLGLLLGRANHTLSNDGIITRHILAENAKSRIRILLAEDNVINQKVAKHMLKNLGYRVDVAASGWEAVRALEMINYDLVLMDCMMPDMDGFEATAMIRDPGSKVNNHDVPIIAMTANAMKGDREKCIEAGMDDYLAKPVKKDDLKLVIERWLTDAAQREAQQQKAASTEGDEP